MTTLVIDTQQAAKRLEARGFTAEQAAAIVDELARVQAELATKADLVPLATKVDLLELKSDLLKWMATMVFAAVGAAVALAKMI